MPPTYRCANCDFESSDSATIRPWWEAKDVVSRLESGDTVPFGLCPTCDCFMYERIADDDCSRLLDALSSMGLPYSTHQINESTKRIDVYVSSKAEGL